MSITVSRLLAVVALIVVASHFHPLQASPSLVLLAEASFCGDGIVDRSTGEQCDGGGEDRFCNANCQLAACGDDIVNASAGEMCEPGISPATCGSSCLPQMCGDGIVDAGEECDDGAANSDTEPDACRTDCTAPRCGDEVLDSLEDADPPISWSAAVPVDPNTCRLDFEEVDQLYCNNMCGNWNGQAGCQRGDADAMCKLLTGNPESTLKPGVALDVRSARAAPGICCPPPASEPGDPFLACTVLGDMSSRGVELVVSVHETDLNSTHGTADAVNVRPEDCTNP